MVGEKISVQDFANTLADVVKALQGVVKFEFPTSGKDVKLNKHSQPHTHTKTLKPSSIENVLN